MACRCAMTTPKLRGKPGGEPMKAIAAALLLLLSAGGIARAALQETPFFEAAVASGKLPKVDERVPREPVIAAVQDIGKPGGELRMLMSSPRDTRMMVVYGYARLVGYTPNFDL